MSGCRLFLIIHSVFNPLSIFAVTIKVKANLQTYENICNDGIQSGLIHCSRLSAQERGFFSCLFPFTESKRRSCTLAPVGILLLPFKWHVELCEPPYFGDIFTKKSDPFCVNLEKGCGLAGVGVKGLGKGLWLGRGFELRGWGKGCGLPGVGGEFLCKFIIYAMIWKKGVA